ncbi:hypothetical protein DFH01_23695 [Falsiroseomonas bella]|uniref:Bacteriophage phiJL001 Gp84 C-terminal domain-containing protein n=1 Tax=Falsiroseomonas bella TaxID=2184016 RepID=A0A317F5V4_9PROT|nr:DUF2163 domain-containing protein [Falsiroseomonas bella]PWS34550.1 hypothetical protein DFH01_23695 [Falsiroseomonas bella]
MKAISAGLAAHLAGQATTLATLWRVQRRDGAVFTFTDHDRDIAYGGETYLAALGYQRAAIATGASLAVDETELLGLLDSAALDPAELRAGLWDHAEVRIFAVNYANLADGGMKLRRGRLGEVIARDDGSFSAELRGLAQPLQAVIGAVYQPECRADLGDARCKLNLAFGAGWTQQASVEAVVDSTTLVLADDGIGGFASTYFEGGVAIWQSGPNAGVAREVLAWDQGSRTLSLFAPPPVAPTVGDVLHLQPGCDKRKATCQAVFDNYLNFRGEPFVPGVLATVATPA